MTILLYSIISVFLLLILLRPYLGLVFISASLPLVNLLPKVPLISTVFPLFGAVTILSYLLNSQRMVKRRVFHFTGVQILGLLFIVWIFISNPEAAWLNRDSIITYVQLWILAFLAGELLDTPQKHQILMWFYSISAIVSAVVAIKQGYIGVDIYSSTRAEGLVEGINTAARYFTVAFVFLIYLRSISHNLLLQIITTIGIILTLLGVIFTISRTGIILLPAAIGLLILLQPNRKYRAQILVGLFLLVLGLWFFSDNIITIAQSILPSIVKGTDTIGVRYELWKAGWRMWLDNPITGVGIGMYRSQLIFYAQGKLQAHLLNSVAHNMYIAVLAETGAIGFILFISIIINSLQNIWRGGSSDHPELTNLRTAWFTVFIIMLLGGITKTDQTDKLLWLSIGISVFFNYQWRLNLKETLRNRLKSTVESK